MWLSVTISLLFVFPACTSLNKLLKPGEDPQMLEVQQKLDHIAILNSSTKRKVDDVYNGILALQATAKNIEANLVAAPAPPRGKLEAKATREGPKDKLKKPVVSPKLSPESQYKKAYMAHTKHHYDEAMALFKKFLLRYPKHDLADNAQYWIGEIYYDLKDYSNAIIAFKEVVAHYADRGKAPHALLKIAYSYIALDDAVNARVYFKKVIKNYPFSKTEAKARAKLKDIENL